MGNISGGININTVPDMVNFGIDILTIPGLDHGAGMLTPALGGVPTIIMGPGEAGMAHKTDEYCRIDRLEQAVTAYTKICAAWCGV